MAQNDSLKYCQTENGTICYREFGVNNDSVILLLHGIPGSSHCFDSLASFLSNRYRVIVPDLLGFGNSSKPKFDYYMTAQAEAVSSLLTDKGVKELTIFGHDFGGPVALTFMRLFSYPKVNKLILSSTNVFTDTYIPPPLRMAKVPILRDLFFWMMAGSRMGMNMTYKQAVIQKDTYTHQMFNKSITKSGMRYTNRIFKKSLSNLKLHYKDIHNYLSEIKIPVLVLWGDADPFFAVNVGERTAKAVQKGLLIVYPKTGHYVPSEQPKAVSVDVLKFLNDGN
ncbi:MAG: alpha/beta hydrolase [Bacteroidetes bacterium]|nr:alpha/beta hydrolase [Bacteroidota bacterium]